MLRHDYRRAAALYDSALMIVPNIISTARVRASYYKAKALVILYLLLRIRKSNRRLRQHSALLYERMQQLMAALTVCRVIRAPSSSIMKTTTMWCHPR